MSLGLGRQFYLQPSVTFTIVGRLRRCHGQGKSNFIGNPRLNFHSTSPLSQRKKFFHLAEKSSRVFSSRAAVNRRGGRDGETTSWDKAAETYFSDGKKTTSIDRAGNFEDRATKVTNSERGGEYEGRTKIASYKTKEDDWQTKDQAPYRQNRRERDSSDVNSERISGGDKERRTRIVPNKAKEDDWQSKNQSTYRQENRERDADGFSNSRSRSATGDRWGGEAPRRESVSSSSESFRDRSGTSSRRPISFRERNSSARNPGFDRGSGGREKQWERSPSRSLPRDEKSDYRSGSRNVESMSRGVGYDRGAIPGGGENRWNEGGDRQEDRFGDRDDWRWRAREPTPALDVEGQAVYGVAPIVSALQACRRTFYTLYMQENLGQNLMTGKRKDKQAVLWIQNKAKALGVTVREASKHDLNMLVDNRPHQGLVLDASPLELVPIDTLEAPTYDGDRAPVWVALDEITDPQNFGAVLRSAYFLGADGVVVCAKNSAPLSGVVSKASAGALEVMDVQYCRSMIKFLDRSREKGWRVLGGSSEPSSVPVRDLPRGIATILVLGNEGRGMRTMVKRSCDELVSIEGKSNIVRTKNNYVFDTPADEDEVDDEDEEYEEGEDEEQGLRTGAEINLGSGPMAVDSLNVSVAAGILLHELIMPHRQAVSGES